MHMADALLSPAVGGTMWAATAAVTMHCSRALAADPDDRRVPLMGVLGAFVFAAQMVNFAIPGTGSSGHLGGGMLLAILLGPHAALVVLASVLAVQALVFGDGGLLALGCNVFNLAVLPCFVAYPLIYRPLAGSAPTPRRRAIATMAAAIIGLQLGALGVVLETTLSGVSALAFASFALLMQPIHLAIGIVEGVATILVLRFLYRAEPDLAGDRPIAPAPVPRRVLARFALGALIAGSSLSWFASAAPDGLEWALERAAGPAPIEHTVDAVHDRLAAVQQRTSLLAGYRLEGAGSTATPSRWPVVDLGTSVSGIVGGVLTLALVAAVGWLVRRRG